MTLPVSPNPISMNDINIELGANSGSTISLNDDVVRWLLGRTVTESAISLEDGYGAFKYKDIALDIKANTTNYNVKTAATAAGYVAGKSRITVTVFPGIVVGSTSSGTPAMTISGFSAASGFNPGDTIKIINFGRIAGAGGAGGNGANNGGGGSRDGVGGGTALSVSYATTIENNGTVAGGGGGGGGSTWYFDGSGTYGGNGGGGGAGRNAGAAGAGGTGANYNGVAGNVGTLTAGGAGNVGNLLYRGGAGGGPGAAGAAGNYCIDSGAVCNLAQYRQQGAGGAAGAATAGNSNITWTVNGTRTGALN